MPATTEITPTSSLVMNRGTLAAERERSNLRFLLQLLPVEDTAAALAAHLFQLYGTGRAVTILQDAANKVNRGDI